MIQWLTCSRCRSPRPQAPLGPLNDYHIWLLPFLRQLQQRRHWATISEDKTVQCGVYRAEKALELKKKDQMTVPKWCVWYPEYQHIIYPYHQLQFHVYWKIETTGYSNYTVFGKNCSCCCVAVQFALLIPINPYYSQLRIGSVDMFMKIQALVFYPTKPLVFWSLWWDQQLHASFAVFILYQRLQTIPININPLSSNGYATCYSYFSLNPRCFSNHLILFALLGLSGHWLLDWAYQSSQSQGKEVLKSPGHDKVRSTQSNQEQFIVPAHVRQLHQVNDPLSRSQDHVDGYQEGDRDSYSKWPYHTHGQL